MIFLYTPDLLLFTPDLLFRLREYPKNKYSTVWKRYQTFSDPHGHRRVSGFWHVNGYKVQLLAERDGLYDLYGPGANVENM